MQPEKVIHKNSILTELKARTAHQHRQTENEVDLMSEDFSRADYRKLLVRFYAFYKPFEAKMRDALRENTVDLDYEKRLNAPKLSADLKKLGMTEKEICDIKSFDDLPALDSPEKIFGALYVVEGSTLGGQIIARHLKEKFGLDAGGGAAFFSGYQAATGRMWNEFRAALTEFAENSNSHEEIIRNANQTFEKIGKALTAK